MNYVIYTLITAMLRHLVCLIMTNQIYSSSEKLLYIIQIQNVFISDPMVNKKDYQRELCLLDYEGKNKLPFK